MDKKMKERQIRLIKIIPLMLFILFTLCLCIPAQAEEQMVLNEYSNLMLPGFSGGMIYFWNLGDIYWGGSFRFDLLYGLDHKRPEASHFDRGRYEFYIDCSLYVRPAADPADNDYLFLYVAGFNLAFESPRILSRDFLIPFIGLELGGLTNQPRGTGLLTSPVLGLNLVSKPSFTLSLDAKLLLNTLALVDFLGLQARINMNLVI